VNADVDSSPGPMVPTIRPGLLHVIVGAGRHRRPAHAPGIRPACGTVRCAIRVARQECAPSARLRNEGPPQMPIAPSPSATGRSRTDR